MTNAKPWEQYFSDEAKQFDAGRMAVQTLPQMLAQSVARYGDKPALTRSFPPEQKRLSPLRS